MIFACSNSTKVVTAMIAAQGESGMEKGRCKLLVIHPDATVSEALFHYLRVFADHIEWCQEGIEGIRRCYQQWYDVVLVARWLRDMDAFELVEKVRLRDQKVPFIILVESVNETLIREAKRVGQCTLCALSVGFHPLEAFLLEMLQKKSRRIPQSPGAGKEPASTKNTVDCRS
jgi:DNA-binding NtrC family response regulator